MMMNRQKAMMIDGDIDSMALSNRTLRYLDVDLLTFSSEHEFFSEIKNIKPIFIMVGINLTDPNKGLMLIQQLRKSIDNDTYIFAVSSSDSEGVIQEALLQGATDYFVKPLVKEFLSKKLSLYMPQFFTSNKNLRSVSGGPQTVSVEFSSQVLSLDEFGIRFESPHLFQKGTIIKLSGKFMEEVTSQNKILVTVVSNSFDSGSKLYGYYAEFAEATEESMNQIRQWLQNKISAS